jgi:hypothetical protein
MRDCCPANKFDGGCEGRDCRSKAHDLGRFTKPRPAPYVTTTPAYGLIGFAIFVAAWVFFIHIAPIAFDRVEKDRQENVAWER